MKAHMFTRDDSSGHRDARMRFYTTEKLGPNQSRTPEGFLLCTDVPIARIGTMMYSSEEVPVPGNRDGFVRIHRDELEVFRPEHMASYAGKPVVNEHPSENVTPETWRKYAVGVVLNPHRGTALQEDLLIADLLITDPQAIQDVLDGKREVSCGYDADYEYEEDRPGEGSQINLIGNHVALVESGRCGPRCAISDRFQGDQTMFTRDEDGAFSAFAKNIKDAFAAKDEKALDAALNAAKAAKMFTADEEGMHIHLHGTSAGNTEGGIHTQTDAEEEEEKRKAEEERKRAGDDRHMSDAELTERFTKYDGMMDKMSKALDAIMKHIGMGADAEAEKAIEGELEEESPPGTGDRARKAHDSEFLEDSFRATAAAAEIIAPGIHIPTFDRAGNPKKSLLAITRLRRNALDLAYQTPEGRGLIEELNGYKVPDFGSMTSKAFRDLFRAVGAAMRAANNHDQRGRNNWDVRQNKDVQKKGPVRTLADLNKLNAEHYAKQH